MRTKHALILIALIWSVALIHVATHADDPVRAASRNLDTGTLTVTTSGQSELFSTNKAASTDGNNLWIGGGGASVAYDGANAFSGSTNTSVGHAALLSNTIGNGNSAFGTSALSSNTTGVFGSAFGVDALLSNTTGVVNSAFGDAALQNNVSGNYNCAFGANSLFSNIDGLNNVSVGHDALSGNLHGNYITTVGDTSMLHHTSGDYQTALGAYALDNDLTGIEDTSIGAASMLANTTGSLDTVVGYNALANSTGASMTTVVGASSLPNYDTVGQTNNTAIGYATGLGLVTGVNETIVGSNISGIPAAESNMVRIADGAGNLVLQVRGGVPAADVGTLQAGSSNASGTVTGIGANTSVTITFSVAYDTRSRCFIQAISGAQVFTVTQSASAPVVACFDMAGVAANCVDFSYECVGQ